MPDNPDIIFIRSLQIQAILGVLPGEREHPQPVVFDIELHTNTQAAARSKRLQDTVDYADVASQVSNITVNGQHLLVETLVEEVAAALLQQHPVSAVRVAAAKPQALSNAAAVGVSIYRQKQH